jgi:hypothetical protein
MIYLSKKKESPGYMPPGKFKKNKYIIQKSNGNPVDPSARYFALKYFALNSSHDPHAIIALKAYAEAVRRDNPLFADQIEKELDEITHHRISNEKITVLKKSSLDLWF